MFASRYVGLRCLYSTEGSLLQALIKALRTGLDILRQKENRFCDLEAVNMTSGKEGTCQVMIVYESGLEECKVASRQAPKVINRNRVKRVYHGHHSHLSVFLAPSVFVPIAGDRRFPQHVI